MRIHNLCSFIQFTVESPNPLWRRSYRYENQGIGWNEFDKILIFLIRIIKNVFEIFLNLLHD